MTLAPAGAALRRTALCLAAVALVATGCTTKPADSTSDGGPKDDASTGSSSGPVTLKDGSQVKLALIPGGAHPYFQPWKATAEVDKADFKLGDVTFNETGEWDQGKQNNVINSLAAQGYNAFGIFGVSPTDINSTFEDLKAKGFAVGSLASCPAGDTNSADFCLSTDVEAAAYKAAKATIEAIGGEGAIVHLTGNNVDSNTQRRIAGVKKAVAETNGKVTELPVITDIDKDLSTAQKAVADLLASKGKDIKGIVTTAYNPAVAAADGVASSKLPIKVVAIDDDAKILSGIKSGGVAATVTQNPVGQAYVGGWLLALLQSKQCTMKTPGVVVDSGSFVVTKDNVDTYDDERKAKTKELETEFAKQLSCQ
ncbi:sugar ABC transporter substrate-binding protein [Kribbella sandramycini]|uniref:Ribose transport system substrate-binding protein n=1 Tax=Kribbella sandramycini TaxID=60450 RepID=A0A7Y4KZQ3_9ACTN|nr:substrate-binding domain-containing protein [Kribbella sandramycini]MBB6565371.1 ribose transport system substrate-binding protein [Kribbella sandramycini]NOL41640.1 sugar ABC transporter substrate-binding protein [Kribbella sandramycini]